jgi:DNA helicase II / ATP-dependent DNA helicase PcrA
MVNLTKAISTLQIKNVRFQVKYCQRIFERGAYELEDLAPLFFINAIIITSYDKPLIVRPFL